MQKVKFKDLAKELGLKNHQLLKLRKQKLSEEEWGKDEDGAWFTAEGADKLRLHKEVPLAVPTRVEMRVIRRAPNPHWVYAYPGKDKPLVPVAIRPSWCDRLIGKPIYVNIIKDAQGGTTYRHEALGK
jgi:hypothetical protein